VCVGRADARRVPRGGRARHPREVLPLTGPLSAPRTPARDPRYAR
jgi:hypothetical protein